MGGRYWALWLLSYVLKGFGLIAFLFTVLSIFTLTTFASTPHQQPLPMPTPLGGSSNFTIPPFPTLPPFPEFQVPNTTQLRESFVAIGAMAVILFFLWGCILAVVLYASGALIVLLIEHETHLVNAANSLYERAKGVVHG